MDTTREEKRNFSRITSVIRLTEAEMIEPGALSTETIQQVCLYPCLYLISFVFSLDY